MLKEAFDKVAQSQVILDSHSTLCADSKRQLAASSLRRAKRTNNEAHGFRHGDSNVLLLGVALAFPSYQSKGLTQ